jgi:hypothetical protein
MNYCGVLATDHHSSKLITRAAKSLLTVSLANKGLNMKIDTRTFKFAGSSADPNGEYKARFANDLEARPKVMTKAGHKDFKLIELPSPMTKLEAIAYLTELSPEGVNLSALAAKKAYLEKQTAKLNGTVISAKRGRPAKVKTVVAKTVKTHSAPKSVVAPAAVPATPSVVQTIVSKARGNSIRAKAAIAAAKL